jgi:peptidoglycan/xylan/chitin deacetylase (PgdA/CDA1 family)
MPEQEPVTHSDDWLQGHAAIAALTFPVDAETPLLAAGRRYAEHAMAMSHQAFGPRVGVPRLLGLLADFDLTATFFVPGWVAENWPHAISAIAEAGHEIAHHSYSHRAPTTLDISEDRREFERGLEALAALGIHPDGYRAPNWAAAWWTPDLIAEYGMRFDTSLMDADYPYVIETTQGSVVELPPQFCLDDWEQYAYLPELGAVGAIETPDKARAVWLAELDGMRRHGGLFQLTSHDFISGRAGRVEGLRVLIENILERGDVGFRTCSQICEAALIDPHLEHRELKRPQIVAETYNEW